MPVIAGFQKCLPEINDDAGKRTMRRFMTLA
jgi:hypothetical protein